MPIGRGNGVPDTGDLGCCKKEVGKKWVVGGKESAQEGVEAMAGSSAIL